MSNNMGVPNSSINLALSDGSQMSSADGEILIALEENHRPTADYVKKLRDAFAREMPELTVFFQPPDIVTQVLNFGLAAPIDVQITGPRRNLAENLKIARQIRDRIGQIPGAVDAHLQQVTETPELHVDVDRTMASQMNLSQRDVANSVLVSLSSSAQVAPNYWLDPKSGVQYTLAVQTPQHVVSSAAALGSTPIAPGGGGGGGGTTQSPQLLTNLAKIGHGTGPTNVTHNNVAVNYDVNAGVQGRDLGRVSKEIDNILDQVRPNLPRGSTVTVRGQVESMNGSFRAMGFGLVFAVMLVYLLMVVNFQSWTDPLIILGALPGAMSGIAWGLFVTHTTLSVPALMGAIMSIGVATANSILMITFANDQRKTVVGHEGEIRDAGMNAHDAALAAGMTRLRPVIMTALAMIIGMLPMSLGLGEGGEQNAPLGRAVIGGLSMATFATLFFVPVVYSLLRSKAPETQVEKELQ
jgi:multidrug efflux pump subunit AcrB